MTLGFCTRGALLGAAIATLGSTHAVFAQTTSSQPRRYSAEDSAIIAVAQRLWDGMRTRDTAMIRSVFDSSARLVGVSRRSGSPRVTITSPDQFIGAVARSAGGDPWIERMWDVEVRVEGDIAQMWMQYDFHLGSKFSHCGIDAFQLARTANGWKVTQLADTRRTEGCTGPPAK